MKQIRLLSLVIVPLALVFTGCKPSRGGDAGVSASGHGAGLTNLPVGAVATVPPGMVLIPQGAFTMGDALDGMTNDLPTIRVNVSAFYMDTNVVSKGQWDEVYRWAVAHGYCFGNAGSGKAANHPVHSVNWYDVVKWCNARSEKEGLVPAYYTSAEQTTVYRSGQVEVANSWVKWNGGIACRRRRSGRRRHEED